MKHVTHIDLVFENCESVTFHISEVKDIQTGNISSYIQRIAVNSIAKIKTTDFLNLIILSSADKKTNSPYCSESAFERILSWADITSITFYFENGTSEDIYVCYCEENEEKDEIENIYQNSFLNENGDLNIIIKKGE